MVGLAARHSWLTVCVVVENLHVMVQDELQAAGYPAN